MAASKQKKDDPFVVTFEERGDQTIVRKSNDLVQMTRNNLTLRTRIKRLARKTLCFSRFVELHEKAIGAFIENHMFY